MKEFNESSIIAKTMSTKGIAKGSMVRVEATDPIKFPNLSKIQSHAITVIGPRGALWVGFVRHDGSIGRFTKMR